MHSHRPAPPVCFHGPWFLTVASLALLWLSVGCASAEPAPAGVPIVEPVVIALDREAMAKDEELRPFAPALESLQQAVMGGDDAMARRILAGIDARRPTGRAAELAAAFRRILDGRDLVRMLDMALEVRPRESDPFTFSVWFTARHPGVQAITLDVAPPTLERRTVSVSADGLESRGFASTVVPSLSSFTVPSGTVFEREVAAFRTPIFGALAVREELELVMRSGGVEFDQLQLPAASPSVAAVRHTFLAPFLPTDPVEPAELVRYVGQQTVRMPPLMERAVRIAPGRRKEALKLLEPVVSNLPEQRVIRILPAIRWLSGSLVTGADIEFWRRWMQGRDPSDFDPEDRPTLNLPGSRP